jgi:dihydroorotase (multifunctional complex type)
MGTYQFDMLIKNVTMVSPTEQSTGYLAVKDGKIAAIGTDATGITAKTEIDGTGKVVIPGCIDAHVHFRDPGEDLTYKEDFLTGSKAAATGGVTTVLDMPNVHPSVLNVKNFINKKNIVSEKAYVNFGLYAFLVDNLDQIEGLIDAGVCAFKWDMGTPDGVLPDHHRLPDNQEAADIFKVIAKHDYMVVVHAEDMDLVRHYTKLMKDQGRDSKDFLAHEQARPDIVELSAILRTLVLSDLSDCRVHITHLSSKRGLELIKDARLKGKKVTCDAGPSWFTFSTEDYATFGGGIRVEPAIRYPADRDALWNGVANGDIDIVATDHAPHSYEEKFDKSWWDTKPGTIGVQTSLPLMLDRVNKGQVTLNRVVECMCAKPAQLFGLYPRKGCLAIGADADITILDMNHEWTITHEEMYSKTKFTPYNGFKIKGKPVTTIVMGNVVMQDGEITGKPGIGKMVNPKKEW